MHAEEYYNSMIVDMEYLEEGGPELAWKRLAYAVWDQSANGLIYVICASQQVMCKLLTSTRRASTKPGHHHGHLALEMGTS